MLEWQSAMRRVSTRIRYLSSCLPPGFLSYESDMYPSLSSVSPNALIFFDASSTGLMREDARRLHREIIDLYDRLVRRAGCAQLSLYRTTIEFRLRENSIPYIPL